jgi:hypothetical protein
VTPDWADPAYVAARKARAVAYADFCRVAGANPHRLGQPEFQVYYESEVMPVRAVFLEAADALTAESARVIRESEEAS